VVARSVSVVARPKRQASKAMLIGQPPRVAR
jgi:hypothetical protein